MPDTEAKRMLEYSGPELRHRARSRHESTREPARAELRRRAANLKGAVVPEWELAARGPKIDEWELW